jgi:type IV secretion system protein VirB8
MNKTPKETRETYYREAESWARDRQESLQASRRIAWMVAAGAALIAVLEAIAIIVLTPLKTVVPYTLLVDKQTGFVQALKPLDADRVAPDAALTQSFLVQYVVARESFEIDTVQANYRKVGLWSADRARTEYVASMQGTSPDSPFRRYPRTTVIEARVKSVTPMGQNQAMVRFDTVRRDLGGQSTPIGAWVAVIRYRFSVDAMSIEDRYLNPLGFQVVRYQRNPEAVTPAEIVAPAPGAVVAPTTAAPGTVVTLPHTTVVVPVPTPAPPPVRRTNPQPRPEQEL